jgi:threonyl-tRNA synthetase
MVHRAIFGSIERFFAILVESFAGEFPLWLAPTQMKLLPVTDDARSFCHDVALRGKTMGLKIQVDWSGERLGKMVRNAEVERVPLMAIVGNKEIESNSLSVRSRKCGDLGSVSVESVMARMSTAVASYVDFDDVDMNPQHGMDITN